MSISPSACDPVDPGHFDTSSAYGNTDRWLADFNAAGATHPDNIFPSAYSKLCPLWPKFGKAFSSDITGDGPVDSFGREYKDCTHLGNWACKESRTCSTARTMIVRMMRAGLRLS